MTATIPPEVIEVPDIVTPCHGAPLFVTTRSEGRPYLQTEVPDELLCSAEGCYNSWDAHGKSDVWNRMPAALAAIRVEEEQ